MDLKVLLLGALLGSVTLTAAAAASPTVDQQRIDVLAGQLSATVSSLTGQVDEATYEAQMAGVLEASNTTCIIQVGALKAVTRLDLTENARSAARTLIPIAARCRLNGTAALTGGGAGLGAGPAFAGGGGGSNYRT